MIALSQVNAALQRQNRKNYLLLVLCNFISVLLITAYVTMMRSPTVLQVLPEGGDSRKQVMMIFVLAVIGCGVFTTYAASLFFRSKARETGIFLALGATRQTLSRQMFRELAQLGIGSCALGALLGTPLAWLLWQGFRLLLVDSQEMAFRSTRKPACLPWPFPSSHWPCFFGWAAGPCAAPISSTSSTRRGARNPFGM